MRFPPRSLIFTTLALSLASPLSACSCIFPGLSTAVARADLIFRGKLSKVEYLDPPRKAPHNFSPTDLVDLPRRYLATIDVDGVWKGSVARQIVIHTTEPIGCSGFWTELGTELLIFAHQSVVTPKQPDSFTIPDWTDKVSPGDLIITPALCSYSSELKEAADTLKQLGPAKRPLLSHRRMSRTRQP